MRSLISILDFSTDELAQLIATAEDIGGSIKGNIIDLYFDTFDECWIFGIRDCTVYILG